MSIKPETLKEMVTKIKQKSPAEKVKLVGLSKLLGDIYTADETFNHVNSKISFESHSKLKDLYTSALEIMSHKKTFSLEGLANPSEYFSEEELKSEEFVNSTTAAPAPEHLWLTLFQKAPVLASHITESDSEILKSLTNVELTLSESGDNFKIEFHFSANDHFTNDKLVLDVVADNESDEIEEIKSTEIQWKAGKDIRNVEVEKKQKNKKSGQIRVTKKLEKTESFFWVFKHHVPADEEDEEDAEPEVDPLGDGELYYNACDIVQFLKDSFFTFFIPAYYGVEIKEFQDQGMGFDGDEEQIKAVKNASNGEGKPECKQQ
jgi:nucleosome assembly protein 1-like 1